MSDLDKKIAIKFTELIIIGSVSFVFENLKEKMESSQYDKIKLFREEIMDILILKANES